MLYSRSSLVIHLKYSSVYVSIPDSQLSLSPSFLPATMSTFSKSQVILEWQDLNCAGLCILGFFEWTDSTVIHNLCFVEPIYIGNHGYQEPTVKLCTDLWLCRSSVTLTPVSFRINCISFTYYGFCFIVCLSTLKSKPHESIFVFSLMYSQCLN